MKNIRLNENAIKDLKSSPSSGTKMFKWDLTIRGFGAYRTAKGVITFLYQYKNAEGRTTSLKIGTGGKEGEMRVEQARAIVAGLAHERRQGIDPIAKRRKTEEDRQAAENLRIDNYFSRYLERREKRGDPMTKKQIGVYRRDLIGPLGHVRIDRLTVKIVEQFGDELYERGPSIMRSGLVCLGALVADAVRRGVAQRCEAHDLQIPKGTKRTHLIDLTEFKRIFEASRDLDDVRADVMEMILRTGKRKEEVAELPWSEIDLATRQWKLPANRNKSKRNKLILLPRQIVELLERQQPDPAKRTGFVFTLNGAKPVEMSTSVKELIDANLHRRREQAAPTEAEPTPCPHWTVHDTRKIPATVLRQDPFRYSSDVVNAVLLHRIGNDLDETYMLTDLAQEAGKALQDWNDHLDRAVSEPDMWPGGRHLPPMKPAERSRRVALLRVGWPQRKDQKRSVENAAVDPNPAGSQGSAAIRKRKERARGKSKAA